MTATDSSTRTSLLQRFAAKAEAIGASVQSVETETAAADVILRAADAPADTATVAERCTRLAAQFDRPVGARTSWSRWQTD
jgi:hypothetical protein